jgi:oligopeptide transport system permease protein
MNVKFFSYIVKRVLLAFVTVIAVITITFFAMQAIPGGPFTSEKSVSADTLALLEAQYGLDKPIFIQYLNYLKGALVWNFGPSIKQTGRYVSDIIFTDFKISGIIGLIALIIATTFGIFFGSIAATRQNHWDDRVIMVFSTACIALPSFIIATVLLLIFCVQLNVLPIGSSSIGGYVLPTLTLSLYPMAYITRLTRSSTLDVLNQDYIKMARAKGLPNYKVIFKHALRNSLTPVITYIGPEFAYIITGSLVVEKIFAIPGLGNDFVGSISNRDYPMIMGTTIFLTDIMVIMLLASDILYKVADPKVDFD